MNAPEVIGPESDGTVGELRATSVQVFTNVNGLPLDRPEFRPLFDRMAELSLPVWVHPARTARHGRLSGRATLTLRPVVGPRLALRNQRLYGAHGVSGLFAHHPDFKIITHHCGAMISCVEGHVGGGLDQLGKPSDDDEERAGKARVG